MESTNRVDGYDISVFNIVLRVNRRDGRQLLWWLPGWGGTVRALSQAVTRSIVVDMAAIRPQSVIHMILNVSTHVTYPYDCLTLPTAIVTAAKRSSL